MQTKNLVLLALFVGIGTVLHTVVPGIYLGMKPDFSLTMMFLGILLFPDKRYVLLLAVATGIISGMTTTFPGGFVPNIIDKFVTGFVFFALVSLMKQYKNIISYSVLTAFGTIISGVVFLGSALLIVGLPGPFAALFTSVVLPAVAFNVVAFMIIYPIITSIAKRMDFAI